MLVDSPRQGPGSGEPCSIAAEAVSTSSSSRRISSARGRPGTITLAILPALPPGLPRAELMRRLEDEVETASAAMLQGSPLPGP